MTDYAYPVDVLPEIKYAKRPKNACGSCAHLVHPELPKLPVSVGREPGKGVFLALVQGLLGAYTAPFGYCLPVVGVFHGFTFSASAVQG